MARQNEVQSVYPARRLNPLFLNSVNTSFQSEVLKQRVRSREWRGKLLGVFE